LLTPYLGFHSVSAEVRVASAIDIALWDIKGQRHGIPVHEALGGASRLEVRAYNTCAGYAYNTKSSRRREIGADDAALGPYDDQIAFMCDAGALAESLVSEGYGAMKIWPFDPFAANGGHAISLTDLKAGLEPSARFATRSVIASRSCANCTACGARTPPNESAAHSKTIAAAQPGIIRPLIIRPLL
jgi:galactonate dehydratase